MLDLTDPAGGGFDSDTARIVSGVAGSLFQELARARSPLDAELVLCGIFGVLENGLPEEADDAEREAALTSLLLQLIDQCRRQPGRMPLAFLRVAATLGPGPSRTAAAQVAGQVSGTGVSDLPWATRVGSPVLVQAWQYGDVFGSQVSIGLEFAYSHREHSLMVLIDHQLGGGIKDAWIAEGRQTQGLRERVVAQMAAEPMAGFADLSGSQALEVLRAALEAPPCPAQPDQLQDVGTHLYLARSRAQSLADALGQPPVDLHVELNSTPFGGSDDAGAQPSAGDVLRIKVSIAGSKPPIWRRLEVSAAMTLADLHDVLQTAFGWTNSHLYCFEAGRRSWGQPAAGPSLEGALLRRRRLGDLAGAPGDVVSYVYDFGDDWVHTILVEDRYPAAPGETYPRCTAGRRAGPREDSGGVPGYEYLLSVLADPSNPEHAEMIDWAGHFDPAAFDREALNRHLAGYAVRR